MEGFPQVTKKLVKIKKKKNASGKGNKFTTTDVLSCPAHTVLMACSVWTQEWRILLVLCASWMSSILLWTKTLFNSHENENDRYCQAKVILLKFFSLNNGRKGWKLYFEHTYIEYIYVEYIYVENIYV